MAHFYGTVTGKAKTAASRLGSVTSGLDTTAASWSGAVRVRLWTRTDDSGKTTDQAEVRLVPWHGHGVNQLLFSGPLDLGTLRARIILHVRQNAYPKPDGSRWEAVVQLKLGDRVPYTLTTLGQLDFDKLGEVHKEWATLAEDHNLDFRFIDDRQED